MWSNRNNNEFYEYISIEQLKEYELLSGLEEGCDLDLIQDLLHSAQHILEIGGGLGRVLRYLTARPVSAEIFAIERSLRLFDRLKAEFGDKATLLLGDILDVSLSQQFDVVLWLWSGFSDFSPIEQAQLLKKLHTFLKPQGNLIIDITRASVKPKNATHADGQFFQIVVESVCINAYVPTEEEMKMMAKEAHLDIANILHYETPTQRPRTLYILKRDH